MEQNKTLIMPKDEIRYVVSDLKVEARAANGEGQAGRTISGYAAVFDTWSNPLYWFREKIARNAFDDTDFSDCIACFNHCEDNILARISSGTLTLSVDERGLKFSFEAPNTTLGNDLLEMVARGDISQCSFKFTVEKDSWIYKDKDNGLEYDQRTIEAFAKVWDVSPVVRPAYDDTSVSARSLMDRKEEYFRAQTLPPSSGDDIKQRHANIIMKSKL